MQTQMQYRGVEYLVSGGWDGESGSYAGPTAVSYIVTRVDGKPIRGVRMLPGMCQVGLSRALDRRAEAALKEALEPE